MHTHFALTKKEFSIIVKNQTRVFLMLWTGKLFVFEFIPFDFVLSWNCKIVIFINNSLDLFKIERVNAKYFHFLLCLFHIAMGTYSIVVGDRPWLSSALICCPASAPHTTVAADTVTRSQDIFIFLRLLLLQWLLPVLLCRSLIRLFQTSNPLP